MTKPMLVTLPAVMLLMDYWPLERYKNEYGQVVSQFSVRVINLISEKIPFLICSFLSGLVAIYAQHKAGAMASFDMVSFPFRLKNAIIAYVTYIGKTVWPHDLALLYPFPAFIPLWRVMGLYLFCSYYQ